MMFRPDCRLIHSHSLLFLVPLLLSPSRKPFAASGFVVPRAGRTRAGIDGASGGPRYSSPSGGDGADDWPLPPLRFDLALEGEEEGGTVPVELTGPGDIARAVRDCLCRAGGDAGGTAEEQGGRLRALFAECWDGHAAAVRRQQEEVRHEARAYDGPLPPSPVAHRRGVAATVPVPGRGLVLEVATSTVAGAGKGLFLRATEGSVWQVRGAAFCGYAGGGFADQPDGDGDDEGAAYRRDRAFEFRLDDGLESSVWFRGDLASIGAVVAATGATRLVGHALEFGRGGDGGGRTLADVRPLEEEELAREAADDQDSGAFRYFVPHGGSSGDDLTIRTLGQMANDLAGGPDVRDEADYRERSRAANALVLVPQIKLVETGQGAGGDRGEGGGVLRPSGGPILTVRETLRLDVCADRNAPMEVGCEYGYHYWANENEER